MGAKQDKSFKKEKKGRRLHCYKGVKHPRKVDWREKGKVTEAKEQGYCGSCWAFVAAGTMESAYAIKGEELVNLSE